MKVSIITVVFNNERTIMDTISSVLSQDYEKIEYIIIDGKSTDSTMEKVNLCRSKIDHIVSERDNGIYDAMNKGIALATGDIVGLLNADDIYANRSVISDVVATFSKTECDAVYGNLYYVNSSDLNKVTRRWISGPFSKNNFLWGWMPPHPSFFVKRELYKRLGSFNTQLRSAADYELMLRFLYVNNVAVEYLNKVLVHMRNGGVSNANLKNRIKANREDRRAWILNDVKPYFFTLFIKPLRKLIQFL